MHMSLFNYLPINAFRLIYDVSIICHQKLETKNLAFSKLLKHLFLRGSYIDYIV